MGLIDYYTKKDKLELRLIDLNNDINKLANDLGLQKGIDSNLDIEKEVKRLLQEIDSEYVSDEVELSEKRSLFFNNLDKLRLIVQSMANYRNAIINLENSKENALSKVLSDIQENMDELIKLKYYEESKYGSLGVSHPILGLKDIDSEKKYPILIDFLKFAKSKDVNMDINFLKATKIVFGMQETLSVSEFIPIFISEYIKGLNYKKLLNPWSKNGTFIIPISKNSKNLKFIGLIQNFHDKEILDIIYGEENIQWELGNIDLIDDKFDIILGLPGRGSKEANFISEFSVIKDNLENIEILKACQHLKDDGTAFILAHPSFILKREENSVFSNLEKNGIYIDSVLEITNFDSVFEIKSEDSEVYVQFLDYLLLILKKKKPSEIFVAELSTDSKVNETILENLKSRQSGKIPQMGILTNINDFYSLKSSIARLELIELVKRSGLYKIPFSEIATNIEISDKRNENQNTVYLPFNIYDDASNYFDDVKTRSNFVLEVGLNNEKISTEYFVNFLNSIIGRKLRESWLDDDFRTFDNYFTTVDYIDIDITKGHIKNKLLNSDLYLTDLNTQLDAITVNNLLLDVYEQLDDYKRQLWLYPLKNEEIKKSVEVLKVADRFEYWLDTLPFPLSSILFTCSVDSNIEHKVRHIIHFFEALSEFNVNIMISAISKDANICKNEFLNCINDSQYSEWYYHPTFGNWNYLGNCIAKKLRYLLNNGKKENILKLFGNPNIKFLEMITNKNLYNILRQAAEYRNQWLGHGPPVDENENRKRLKILSSLLVQTRQIISNNYEDALLIQPTGSMSYEGAIFNNKVKLITGRLPFKNIKVETINPLENNKLYFIHKNQHEALELLPLFRIMESPKREQNACYFYNRLDNKKGGSEVRLVSYHFDKESEVTGQYNEFQPLFSLFQYRK